MRSMVLFLLAFALLAAASGCVSFGTCTVYVQIGENLVVNEQNTIASFDGTVLEQQDCGVDKYNNIVKTFNVISESKDLPEISPTDLIVLRCDMGHEVAACVPASE